VFIDADTHVDECDDTWSYMPESSRNFTPRSLEFSIDEIPEWLSPNRSSGSGYYRFWFINGQLFPHRVRSDERTGTTQKTRELLDVSARLRDMDELGVQTQVVYPTVFLTEITRRPEIQAPIYQSYNRWVAERCADANGRLRWVAMIPYLAPEAAMQEMAFAKENGACGIFKLGYECERQAGDPYFLPYYRRAAELDLAVSIHQGSGWTPVAGNLGLLPIGSTGGGMPVLQGFASLLGAKIHEKVPGLRVGFIESASAWLPYLFGQAGWNQISGRSGVRFTLEDLRFYITCETYEDIPYLLKVAGGNDNLVVGSDYCHGDRASVIDAHKRIVEREDIDPESTAKIVADNATRLYGLTS
jgi:predicted TIM-barrel fold metal-dependent hydrolase